MSQTLLASFISTLKPKEYHIFEPEGHKISSCTKLSLGIQVWELVNILGLNISGVKSLAHYPMGPEFKSQLRFTFHHLRQFIFNLNTHYQNILQVYASKIVLLSVKYLGKFLQVGENVKKYPGVLESITKSGLNSSEVKSTGTVTVYQRSWVQVQG